MYLTAKKKDENQASQDLSKFLLPLIRQLPEIYHDTLIATDLEGKTLQSVALEKKLSLLAIKSRASWARKMLKEQLLICCQVELSATGGVMDYYVPSRSEHEKGDYCIPYST